MLYNVRVRYRVRSLCHRKLKKNKHFRTRPFEGERQKLCGIVSLPNDKRTHAYTHTHAHPLSVTLPDKHAHALTLVLISPVSLQ